MQDTEGDGTGQPNAEPISEEKLRAECIASVEQELQRLVMTFEILDDALKHKAIKDWMPVRSVINLLTDKTEVDKIIASVPATSRFYKNAGMVSAIVNWLSDWRDKGFFFDGDSIVDAYNILDGHRVRDKAFLDSYIK